MGLVLAQVAFPHISGLPQDVTVNTWHFDVPDEEDAQAYLDIQANLLDFYTLTVAPGGASIDDYFSSVLVSPATVRYYRQSDPEPRVPVALLDLAFSTGNGTPVPSEVALCLSYKRPIVSGTAPARAKGRVYLGPWDSGALAEVDSRSRPAALLVATIAGAAERLLDSSIAAGRFDWVQYSPTANIFEPVSGGWVDNAWDTQRRRGEDATARTTWGV